MKKFLESCLEMDPTVRARAHSLMQVRVFYDPRIWNRVW